MNIWFGIDVDNYYKDVKKKVQKIEKDLNITLGMILPYHISLKMSFNVSDSIKDDVIDTLINYFKCLATFVVETKGIEKHDNIIWVRMKKSDILNNIHIDLNSLLLEKYSISLHEYDLDFLFHTTLFMDDDKDKISNAFKLIKDIEVPKEMTIDKYLIGVSDTGKPGTYKIIKEIRI